MGKLSNPNENAAKEQVTSHLYKLVPPPVHSRHMSLDWRHVMAPKTMDANCPLEVECPTPSSCALVLRPASPRGHQRPRRPQRPPEAFRGFQTTQRSLRGYHEGTGDTNQAPPKHHKTQPRQYQGTSCQIISSRINETILSKSLPPPLARCVRIRRSATRLGWERLWDALWSNPAPGMSQV